MSILRKEDAVFKRDGEGKLLAVEVELKDIKGNPTIKVIPLVKGDVDVIFSIKDNKEESLKMDKKIVIEHCIEPSFTAEDIDFMKPNMFKSILNTIIGISLGMVVTQENKQEIIDGEDFLSKSAQDVKEH